MSYQVVNFCVIMIANLFNLSMIAIMLSRPKGWARFEHYLGLLSIFLMIPLGLCVIYYGINEAQWWIIVLPGLLIIFLLVELILDYILKLEFRQTRWLGSYLLLFYAAQWGMIGFGFLVGQIAGFITLLTYFLSLAATAFSYKKVGHGNN